MDAVLPGTGAARGCKRMKTSEAKRAAQRAYEQSEAGKATQRRYNQSAKGIIRSIRYDANRRVTR